MEEKIKLLLIDDEEAICAGVRDMLKREAFEIEYRLSAEEGIEYLENHKTDIVLLDINLGQGLNGVEALKLIKSKHKDIEVIMLTGENALTTGIDCMKNGAFDYMTKPFKKELFLEKANDAAARKKYNEITEKDRDAMVKAMSTGVSHQFGNRITEFVYQHYNITEMLNEARELCVGEQDEKSRKIAAKLEDALKAAGQFGANIEKSKNILNSIRGYENLLSEKDKYCFMFIEDITNIAACLLKLNNKLDEAPIKKVNIINKTFYGIKSVILEVIYGCLQNAYEAVETRRRFADESEKAANPPEIILSYSETPHSHIIEIKDNGKGIEEANKKKIFAPFFTTKPSSAPGLGSGLYIMKKMIEEQHRGKLTVESEYGKGTTVKIEIPRETGMQTVLIIDDEKEISEIMIRMIRRKGFTAVAAETAAEGVQKYKEVKPLCVLLDMKLKGTEGGEVALEQLLKIDPLTYVYIMTGNHEMDENTAKKMGAKGYIHKPAAAEDLLEKIKIAAKEKVLK